MEVGNKHYSRYFTYIEPVLKTPLIKTYGSLILTIIILIIAIAFAIRPTLNTISNLQKELEVKQQTLAAITQKTNDLTAAKKNYDNLDPNIKAKIETTIPKDPQVSILVKSLEDTASKSQASMSALQFQPITIEPPTKQIKDSTLEEIPFVYNVEDSYEALSQILNDLKSNARLVTIEKFSVNKIEGTTNLLLSVTGKAYYVK